MTKANINLFFLIILKQQYKGNQLSVALHSNAHLVIQLYLSPIIYFNITFYYLNKLIVNKLSLKLK